MNAIAMTELRDYFGKTMYRKTDNGKYQYVPASKVFDGWKNRDVLDVMLPLAEAVLKSDFGKGAGSKSSVSNAKIISGLTAVSKMLGLTADKTGADLVFLGCDANAWKLAVLKCSATGMSIDMRGKAKIVKATLEVMGKRYRRRYYTANGGIQ